jgi:hypothetical protein
MLTPSESRHFGLPRNVYACITSGHLVFLDLTRDRYFCLDTENTRAAIDVLSAPGSVPLLPGTKALQLATELEQKRLIARNETRTLRNLQKLDAPSEALNVGLYPIARGLSRRFLVATSRAFLRLQFQQICETVEAIRTRRGLPATETAADPLTRISVLAATFNHLRPLFPKSYVCLFDCLALLEFLAPERLQPSWVFGVKLNPFGAHCWLQQGTVLINDRIDHVRCFEPILTI